MKEDNKKEQEAAADGDNDEDDSTVVRTHTPPRSHATHIPVSRALSHKPIPRHRIPTPSRYHPLTHPPIHSPHHQRKPLTQTMVAACRPVPDLPSLAEGEGWVVSDLIRVWDLVSVFHKTIGVTPFEIEDLIGSLSYVWE